MAKNIIVVYMLLYLVYYLIFRSNEKENDLCISDHCIWKSPINVCFSHFIHFFLYSFIFVTTAFIFSTAISIGAGIILMVTITVLRRCYSLSYLNNIFSYQSSLPEKSVVINYIVFSLLRTDREMSCLWTSREQRKYFLFFETFLHI
jgi:hypothetical protein